MRGKLFRRNRRQKLDGDDENFFDKNENMNVILRWCKALSRGRNNVEGMHLKNQHEPNIVNPERCGGTGEQHRRYAGGALLGLFFLLPHTSVSSLSAALASHYCRISMIRQGYQVAGKCHKNARIVDKRALLGKGFRTQDRRGCSTLLINYRMETKFFQHSHLATASLSSIAHAKLHIPSCMILKNMYNILWLIINKHSETWDRLGLSPQNIKDIGTIWRSASNVLDANLLCYLAQLATHRHQGVQEFIRPSNYIWFSSPHILVLATRNSNTRYNFIL